MSDVPFDTLSRPRVFALRSGSRWKAIACFWSGIALVGVGVIGFFIAIRTPSHVINVQLMTTLPIMLAIGLFATSRLASHHSGPITLFDDHIEIRQSNANLFLPLAEVSMAIVSSAAFTRRRRLKIFDRSGRCVAVIPDTLDAFDELVTSIQQDIQQHEDNQVLALRLKKARQQAVLLALLGVVFGGLVVGLAVNNRYEARMAQLLRERGQPAMATILRHFTAPNGVTRRIEYRVTDPSGLAADHNAEVDPAIWALLKDVKAVSVIAVPGRPDITRLSMGEITGEADLSPGAKILIYIIGGVLSVAMLIAALLNWRGIDIDWDSKTRKLSIKKFGVGS